MKKIIALLLAAVMVMCLFAGCASSGGSKVIKIGVFEPQSGDNGAGGKQEVLGMQYANYVQPTVEIGGETYDVKLEIVDNRTTAENGPSAASELMNRGVSIVLGSYGSGVSMAGGTVFQEAGVPAIGVTCTNPQITEGNDHYFRICFLDPFQGTVLANFAKDELKAEKVYCLGQLGNDYDQGLMNYFKQAAEKLGMECVVESFPKNNSDFTSYLTTAKNEGADVIFAPTSISYAQLIVEQAAAQGIDMPLLASDTWDSNVILGAAKGKDVKVYVTTFYAEGGNAEFEKGFKEWIKSDSTNLSNNGGNDIISAVSVMGYDAYYTALEALKAAGTTNPQDVMAALPGVKYTGITGEISFNEEGDANRDSAFVKTANTESGLWDFVTVQGIDGAQ